jgi:hypothetical protein
MGSEFRPIAMRLEPHMLHTDDLAQVGAVELLEAYPDARLPLDWVPPADWLDLGPLLPVKPYLRSRVTGAMRQYLRDKAFLIRSPEEMHAPRPDCRVFTDVPPGDLREAGVDWFGGEPDT